MAAGVLCSAPGAYAATHTVDDDKADCPAAGFTSVQAAVDAAAAGDTIVICAGDYVEGSGQPGTNAVTIQKNLTLKGAGAHLVTISPKASGLNFGNIMEAQPELRNGVGDIIAIVGTPTQPLTAHISGVTVDGYDPAGRPVAVEAGIAFVDAKGSVKRSHVTNVVTSEGDNAYTLPGGWRGPQPGIGIVQTSRALLAPVDGSRRLEIDRTRVDKYNRVGVLIDGAQNDFSPFAPTGAVNWGVITSSQIVGRTVCVNYAGTGSCVTAGQVTTGPLFGQDGLRVTAGAYATVDSSLISQNLVHGEGAPVRSTTTPAIANPPTPAVFTPNSTNNQNLILGAGVRYAGARLTSYTTATGRVVDSLVTRSNIIDNSFGAVNVTNTGAANAGNPNPAANAGYGALLKAEDNWWGVRNIGTSTVTPPPEINPAYNPPVPENPVNGAAAPDEIAGQTTSNAVDFYPYRSGPQSDPATGAWPILTAPLPVVDAAPTAGLSAPASAARGSAITLTATGSDDFGVKRVRFADGASTLGTVSTPPYTLQATIPADAACGSSRTYTAVVMDSLGQTRSASATVAVTCTNPNPNPDPEPAAPSIAFDGAPTRLAAGRTLVAFAPTAQAGIRRVELFLGDRRICTLTQAPFTRCYVTPTGADVGRQALRVVVTDLRGSTAQATTNVTVAKFPAQLSLKVKTKGLSGGRARRTITATVKRPDGVTAAQGCSGRMTLKVKRNGRTIVDDVVKVARNCRVSLQITAPRRGQTFKLTAEFGGNPVLRTAEASRRFS